MHSFQFLGRTIMQSRSSSVNGGIASWAARHCSLPPPLPRRLGGLLSAKGAPPREAASLGQRRQTQLLQLPVVVDASAPDPAAASSAPYCLLLLLLPSGQRHSLLARHRRSGSANPK